MRKNLISRDVTLYHLNVQIPTERCRDAMKDVSMTHTQEKKQLRETVLEEVKIWTY
jgi:hypothetical protein